MARSPSSGGCRKKFREIINSCSLAGEKFQPGTSSAIVIPCGTSWHFTTYRRQVIIIPYRVRATIDIAYSRSRYDEPDRDALVWAYSIWIDNKKEDVGKKRERVTGESTKCLTPIRVHKRVYRQAASPTKPPCVHSLSVGVHAASH